MDAIYFPDVIYSEQNLRQKYKVVAICFEIFLCNIRLNFEVAAILKQFKVDECKKAQFSMNYKQKFVASEST